MPFFGGKRRGNVREGNEMMSNTDQHGMTQKKIPQKHKMYLFFKEEQAHPVFNP